MEYWLPATGQNGYIYSCDMLRYKLEIKDLKYSHGILQQLLTAYGRFDVKQYPANYSDFKFRQMFTIDYGISSMTVGIGFNGCKQNDMSIGFLEVNPNKCFDSLQCLYDVQHIFDACWSFEFLRFDLAIDVPLPRDALSLVKDGRKYMLDMYSSTNKTEYLGVRNASGYVKLYNKAAEQKKNDEQLTRLEMTCAGNMSADQIIAKLPYVFVVSDQFSGDDDLKELSSSQKVLVRALRSHPDRDELFRNLCAGVRVKLRPYIYGGKTTLEYDGAAIGAVLSNIRQFEQSMTQHAYSVVSQDELKADAERRLAKKRGSEFIPLTAENPFDNESKMV